MLSVAVLPLPPLVEVMLPVVFFRNQAVVPVTVTLNVQLPPAAIDPPLSEITPVAAVVVKVPPHWVVDVLATVNPAGSVSVKATPVSAVVVFGFVILKLRVFVPPTRIVSAPNDLAILGGATTFMLSSALPSLLPSVEVT